MEVEAGGEDPLANAVLVAPGEDDGDARPVGERLQEPERGAVTEHEVGEQGVDVESPREVSGLLAGMRTHDVPTSTRERELEQSRSLAVVEDGQHHGSALVWNHGPVPQASESRAARHAAVTVRPLPSHVGHLVSGERRRIREFPVWLAACNLTCVAFSKPLPELRFADAGCAGAGNVTPGSLDLSRRFLPEALAGLAPVRALDETDRRRLNQIRACSYLHLFDTFEHSLGAVARERSRLDIEVRDVLAPLLHLDCFDHHDLFFSFEKEFADVFPVQPRLVPLPADFAKTLTHAAPLSLLVLALHFKLVTQQHYLACVRGDESLEPRFVRLLKDHWCVECGGTTGTTTCGSVLSIQQALGKALPGRIPSALRDYRLLVFACDDVLRRQAELDVATLEDVRGHALSAGDRTAVVAAQVAAHRKTFLTVGIVNAAFVYAMRSLGPTAPAMLAGVVSALSAR